MSINSASILSFQAISLKPNKISSQNRNVLNPSVLKLVSMQPKHIRANFLPFMGRGGILFSRVEETEITFDKIGGLKQPKALLEEFKSNIISTKPAYQLKQTCILQGDSLSGKTALVNALANELEKYNIPVIKVSGGDFALDDSREAREDFNGSGSERMANLFWFAKKQANTIPGKTAVIFIDDIDALLPIRTSDKGSDVTVNVNQLFAKFMAEIDNIQKDPNNRIFVIATSSNSSSIDKAAFDRFQTIVNVVKPKNKNERLEIIKAIVENRGFKLEDSKEEEIIERMAHFTGGYYPGRLVKILEIASEYAKANNHDITLNSVIAAHLNDRDGCIRPLEENLDFVNVSIAHELGHAISRIVMNRVADKLESQHNIKWGHSGLVNCINLDPRDGYSASLEVLYNYKNPFSSFEYNFAEMVSNYASSPCEALFNGLNTNGTKGDQINTYELVKNAVRSWGMGKTTSKVVPGIDKVSDEWEKTINDDVKLILNSASDSADEIVEFYKDFILETSHKYLGHVIHNKELREQSGSAYPEPNIIMDKELYADLEKWESKVYGQAINAMEDKIIERIKNIRPEKPSTKKLAVY